MADQPRSLPYYDFMGVGSRDPYVENSWPIKKELTSSEVRDDIFYMEKQAFDTYILPHMPKSKSKRLTKGAVVKILLKDERCVFFMTQLYMSEGSYMLTNFQCQKETFIRSRMLVAGQTIWLRWTNGYMELKVLE